MKRRYDAIPNKARLDTEQAFRLGFTDAQRGIAERTFTNPVIRRHWKRGFNLGRKGLVVTLPKLPKL